MRKLLYVLGLVCLASVSAAAQDGSTVDLFAGYSYVHTGPGVAFSSFNANGGVGSVALNFNSWGSLVGEVGGVHVSRIGTSDVDATALTFMAGPKNFLLSPLQIFSLRAGPCRELCARIPISIRPLALTNTFALQSRRGLDWNATRHFGIRLGQLDYLLTRIPTSTNQVNWNNFRYSAGVVFRF